MKNWSYFFVYFLCLAISSLSGIAKANEQLEESPYGRQEEIATIQKELNSILGIKHVVFTDWSAFEVAEIIKKRFLLSFRLLSEILIDFDQ